MNFFAGILTFLLVVDCFVLILLVLVQLPKKDAGAGMAFGAGTADALFGAGSGNALTKITKYAAVVLLGLSLVIGMIQNRARNAASAAAFERLVEQKQMQTTVGPAPGKTAAQLPPAAGLPAAVPATNAPAAK